MPPPKTYLGLDRNFLSNTHVSMSQAIDILSYITNLNYIFEDVNTVEKVEDLRHKIHCRKESTEQELGLLKTELFQNEHIVVNLNFTKKEYIKINKKDVTK